jgi:peroxiredoxin
MRISIIAIFLFVSIWKVNSQINNDYLKIGENAPRILGIDQFTKKIDSDDILKNNKILLIFYRGNWCPYCKKHLASLQENLDEFTKKGVYVIVVTPEKVDKVKETSTKFKATFSIIHDVDNKIMNDYKVAFDVNKDNVPNYFEFTLKKVRAYNESNNDVLPVPATYLIDKNALISYVHYDPDYKERADLGKIINLLE